MDAVLSALLLLAAPSSAAPRPEPKPNIVVLDICSARADRFGAYGSTASLTPGLDAFATGAAVFERAWAQSSWCLPNYATLLTGQRPEAHGRHVNAPGPLDPGTPTLAERLKDTGYRTGGFTGGVYLLPGWGLSRGFDHYHSVFSTASSSPEGFSVLAPDILRWIDEPSGAPFFLYATVDDLHSPYGSEAGLTGEAGLSTATAGVRFFRAYNGEKDGDLSATARRLKGDAAYLRALSSRYDGAVRGMDRVVSSFLADLERRGLMKNTLVIVTADHGEHLGEKGLLGHTEGLYEPVLRVPLLVRDPARPASHGKRIGALVERVDLAPTLLDAAGAPDASLPGRSLRPLLSDPRAPWRTHAYASSQRNAAAGAPPYIEERAVTDGRWKLIWYAYRDAFELYDLAADPHERNDLAASRPEVAARLAFELQRAAEEARRAGRPGQAPRLVKTVER